MRIGHAVGSDNARGAVYMMASMGFFVVNDAMMKSLAGETPLFQAIFIRGLFATILVFLLARARDAARLAALAPSDRKTAIVRSGAELGATSCFLTALFAMPIADATAILQSTPIALTVIGAFFLGERVGWRRWSAVIAGFVGVLMIVRPTGDGLDEGALFALAAVGFICLRDLATKRLSPTTPSLLITLITAASITVMGGAVTLTQTWAPMTPATIGVLALSACFLCLGYLFSVMTMRVGEMTFVSPFRYTILIWALLLGLVAFGEVPDAISLTGAAIVVAAGLYTFIRERRLKEGEL